MVRSGRIAPAETPTAAAPGTTGSSLTGKYLIIVLDREAYAIAVLKIREIIRQQQITPVPQLPESVKGVINLRGRVIPVLDLRVKFGLKAELAERTCIVVVQVRLASGTTAPMGLVVDAVDEVVTLAADDIELTPHFGTRIAPDYLLGMAKVKGELKMLLDIDRVVTGDVAEAIATAET